MFKVILSALQAVLSLIIGVGWIFIRWLVCCLAWIEDTFLEPHVPSGPVVNNKKKKNPWVLICPICKPKYQFLECEKGGFQAKCPTHGVVYDFKNNPPPEEQHLPRVRIVGLKP